MSQFKGAHVTRSRQIEPNKAQLKLPYFTFQQKRNVQSKLLKELDTRSEQTAATSPPQEETPVKEVNQTNARLRRPTGGTQTEALKGGRLGSYDRVSGSNHT